MLLGATESLLVLHVSGPSFLHRMVRCIAGLLVAVGGGRLGEGGDVAYALTGAMDGPQIPALPAQGLTLWSVNYPDSMEPAESYGGFPEEPMFPV
jgi:tRNA U38,U39,U40 pseudouridine synthase TruA